MLRKLLCNVSAVAMMAGLFVVSTALPAQAVPPTDTHNFMPDDTEKTGVAPTSTGIILSDRFDGEDSTSHLTNVATSETTRVQWRLCSEGTVAADGTEELTQAEFDACTIVIGEDTSPNTPAGDPPAGVDEAYEFDWNIPGTEDGATRDIVAAACIGAGEDVENDPSPAADESNCVVDVENDVLLDDAQTATPLTTAGEITELCTADPAGPGVGDDLCVRDAGDTDAEVDARFFAFEHGDNVPNDGFVFRAMTSDDVDSLIWNLGPGDAETDPDASPDTGSCTSIFTGTNFQEWECQVPGSGAPDVPDDAELHLTIEENNGGSGLCADPGGVDPDVDCDLDSHYVVSNERRPESVVATFATDDDLTREEQCEDPDTTEANNLGELERVLFCVFDQFGQPIDTPITFESSGPSTAGFDATEDEDCTAENHDDDAAGVDEHCDGTTGTDGIAEVDAANPDDDDDPTPGPAETGVQNITACVESEPDPDVAAHGCADEPANLVDDVDKTWESNAFEVTLVFSDSTNPKDTNCLTGPTFRENQVNEEDDLLACVFDFFGNPIPTTGEDDGFLEWSIDAGDDDEVDTQYVGTPPSESDGEGEAVARIRAINPGSDEPTVCLRDDDTGDETDCDFVDKNVTGIDGGDDERAPSTVTIRHRAGPHRFIGRVRSPDDSCEPGRRVIVRRVRRGRDPRIGADTTNARGRYRVGHRRTRSRFRYYARVRGNADCLGDSSRRTPRVR